MQGADVDFGEIEKSIATELADIEAEEAQLFDRKALLKRKLAIARRAAAQMAALDGRKSKAPKAVEGPSVKDRALDLLATRGPLDSRQIAEALGVQPGQVGVSLGKSGQATKQDDGTWKLKKAR